ncbi:hypothetical protein YC2023_014059 [Brassica napus]|uniref:(rape) hypothetical protein n=1 Tax=Brassica napus TaxID=3708 RepID=A0A816JWS5_BRANA|nr:unnamed protein product [Brassica napus]
MPDGFLSSFLRIIEALCSARTISLVSVVMYVFNQSKKEEEYRDESRILGRLQSIRAAPLSLDSVLDRKMPA